MKEGRKPEYPENTPGDELEKMPQTKARRFKPQARLEPVQLHRWQARKPDVLTVTPRTATAFLLSLSTAISSEDRIIAFGKDRTLSISFVRTFYMVFETEPLVILLTRNYILVIALVCLVILPCVIILHLFLFYA